MRWLSWVMSSKQQFCASGGGTPIVQKVTASDKRYTSLLSKEANIELVDWDGLRKALLDNVSIAALGRELGVDECILINPETVSDADGRLTTDKMVATAMEAVAGAVYLDGGESKLGDLMRWLKYDQHSLLV